MSLCGKALVKLSTYTCNGDFRYVLTSEVKVILFKLELAMLCNSKYIDICSVSLAPCRYKQSEDELKNFWV